MPQRGDLVPQFDLTTLAGERVTYSTIWQRKNLVLVTLGEPESEAADRYAHELTARMADFGENATACVITRERVPGVPDTGVLVADRWGEIVRVFASSDVAELPDTREILEWINYMQSRCPECEGEAK
jgi:hypothetical protein